MATILPMSSDSGEPLQPHRAPEAVAEKSWTYTIICPRCLKPFGGDNAGQANKAWAAHFLTRHA